jgi:hypothetical protein
MVPLAIGEKKDGHVMIRLDGLLYRYFVPNLIGFE